MDDFRKPRRKRGEPRPGVIHCENCLETLARMPDDLLDMTITSFTQALTFKSAGFKVHDTMLYVKKNPIPSDCGKRYRQCFEYMFCFSKGQPKTFNPITEPTKSAGQKITAFRITGKGRGNVPDEDIGREIKSE